MCDLKPVIETDLLAKQMMGLERKYELWHKYANCYLKSGKNLRTIAYLRIMRHLLLCKITNYKFWRNHFFSSFLYSMHILNANSRMFGLNQSGYNCGTH